MPEAIVNNRVAGTRITVWDVYHYLEDGDWTVAEIADVLGITVEQVQAAALYIEENKDFVLSVHREIEERHARGNPPQIEAKRQQSHAKVLAWLHDRQAQRRGGNGNGNPG
jgi:uncharacterized protein (DUF433 family)